MRTKSRETLVRALIKGLGEDVGREGLIGTPARVSAAWDEWTSGYADDPAEVLRCFADGSERYDEMVFEGNIPFYSHCEHHMAPFFGVAYIGYIPRGKVVGLSKLSRLVDIFARRLQVQERLTRQVAESLMEHVDPLGVGVVLRARHLCMESRGIRKPGVYTITSAMQGVMLTNPVTRSEFFSLVRVSGAEG